ncbi:hypothetical protein WG915_03235 [Corynebacterium sp. H128]|uniref:hypothetical protein n=1 Tax=unclassified Corynebacterium TaxID=2624378 RepID=UPI00309E79F8
MLFRAIVHPLPVLMVSGVVACLAGCAASAEAPERASASTAAPAIALPEADNDYLSPEQVADITGFPGGAQLSFERLSDGTHTGSANERFPRPALSLIKLYIADFVLAQDNEDDKDLARIMISDSDDYAADTLYAKYPESIATTVAHYGLWSTHDAELWGNSVTSTYDAVKFIRIKLQRDPDSPILAAMREKHEVAADGYAQNFGTSVLPRAEGTKWGWSDDLMLHSSISFGDDYVAAAAVMGSAEDLTALVERQLGPALAAP